MSKHCCSQWADNSYWARDYGLASLALGWFPVCLRGMRVYVREPTVEDAEAFIGGSRRSMSFHRPWVFPSTTMTGFLDYLSRSHSDRHASWLVFRKRDHALVGVINLNEIIRGALQSGFIGYWGFRGYEGCGYMSEGLALAFDRSFEQLELHRLEVNIQPRNKPSVRLAKRLGCRLEGFSPKYLKIGGEWRDHERWVMLAEEWREMGGAAGVVKRLSEKEKARIRTV